MGNQTNSQNIRLLFTNNSYTKKIIAYKLLVEIFLKKFKK